MLYSLIGSPSDIDTDDKVLLIEDLDEYLYHIDRMMLNLRRSGKLSHVKALLVGHLSDMHDNTVPFGKRPKRLWPTVAATSTSQSSSMSPPGICLTTAPSVWDVKSKAIILTTNS